MTMIDPSELDTQEFPLAMDVERLRPASSSVRVDVAALSDKGKVRDTNQDHYLVARAGRHLDTMLTNLPEDELPARFEETSYVAIVADGMGAMREVKSRAGSRSRRSSISSCTCRIGSCGSTKSTLKKSWSAPVVTIVK